ADRPLREAGWRLADARESLIVDAASATSPRRPDPDRGRDRAAATACRAGAGTAPGRAVLRTAQRKPVLRRRPDVGRVRAGTPRLSGQPARRGTVTGQCRRARSCASAATARSDRAGGTGAGVRARVLGRDRRTPFQRPAAVAVYRGGTGADGRACRPAAAHLAASGTAGERLQLH